MTIHRRGLVVGVPREAFRPSAIFLSLVALMIASGVMAWQHFGNVRFDVFLFVVSGWLVSLCLHEYGHAVLAYRGGDVAVAHRGYLTLNPLKYTHWFLSFVLPLLFVLLGGIGLPGGAVWVDKHALRSKLADSLVSAAGPAMNLLFALGLSVPFIVGVDVSGHVEFWVGVGFLAFLQLTATLLNLLPIPGVDGAGIIHPWMSYPYRRFYDQAAPYGMFVLFALLWNPTINRLFFGAVFFVASLIGLPDYLYGAGFHMIRFWSDWGN